MTLARNFLEDGANCVLLTSNSRNLAEKLGGKLNTEWMDRLTIIESDFRHVGWFTFVREALQNSKQVPNVLINNAATNIPVGRMVEIPIEKWREHFEINFFSHVALTQLFIEKSLPGQMRWVFNMSGGGATKPMPFFGPYACSKTALIRFTETLANEMKDDLISINAIAPGFLATGIHNASIASDSSLPTNIKEPILRNLEKGGEDPNKTYELIKKVIKSNNPYFSGNLLSAIWDDLTVEDFEKATLESNSFKLRRIEK